MAGIKLSEMAALAGEGALFFSQGTAERRQLPARIPRADKRATVQRGSKTLLAGPSVVALARATTVQALAPHNVVSLFLLQSRALTLTLRARAARPCVVKTKACLAHARKTKDVLSFFPLLRRPHRV